ncbi:hypothetical protein, partial [Nocardia abscessus]|uniref:hypothetical protein n=1 Tax=Nocardia abscessus TaxID=120957 RepID=UPI0024547531
ITLARRLTGAGSTPPVQRETPGQDQSIAIVGLSCRFPGAPLPPAAPPVGAVGPPPPPPPPPRPPKRRS